MFVDDSPPQPSFPAETSGRFRGQKRQYILLALLLAVLLTAAGAGLALTHRHSAAKTPAAPPVSGNAHAGVSHGSAAAPAKPNNATKPAGASTAPKVPASTSPGSHPAGGSSGSTSGSTSTGDTSGSTGSTGSSGGGTPAAVTLHYTANIGGQTSLAASLGFNLFDVNGSVSNPGAINTTVNSLPSGVKALVWVGSLDNTNCTPTFSYAQFTAQVDALKNNPRVFGYYLSDEPHPSICPGAAHDIQARADYIRANAPSQKSFIVILDGSNMCGATFGCEYSALRPSVTHVDYVGIDPYPCHYAGDGVTPVACDNSAITSRVNAAISSGIPASAIIPTFQTFGQSGRTDGKTVYYRMPSSTELTSMMNTWASLVPHPAFDYAYSFGVQCSSSCPAPQAVANTPDIQTVVGNHNK